MFSYPLPPAFWNIPPTYTISPPSVPTEEFVRLQQSVAGLCDTMDALMVLIQELTAEVVKLKKSSHD